MAVLFESFSLVAIAEIGDKTQLLSIILATRFKRFWPIVLGVLAATLINHGLVALLGNELGSRINPHWLNLGVSLLFIGIGFWVLIPDKAPETEKIPPYGAFLTSAILFFMAEMGDKTQLATLTLGAHYSQTWLVTIGTTLGMLAANIPAILFGETLLAKLPLKVIRHIASAWFVAYGLYGLYRFFQT